MLAVSGLASVSIAADFDGSTCTAATSRTRSSPSIRWIAHESPIPGTASLATVLSVVSNSSESDERGAGLGEECGAFARAPLLVVEFRGRERGRRHVPQRACGFDLDVGKRCGVR